MSENTMNLMYTDAVVIKGSCYVLVAYDVGLQVKLDRVEDIITENKERVAIVPRHRAPKHFEFKENPLRVTQSSEPIAIGAHQTMPTVDLTLYEFGTVSFTYRIPLHGRFNELLELSDTLYENTALREDSRQRVEAFLKTIESAVTKPRISVLVEDYVIFELTDAEGGVNLSELMTVHREEVAQLLRSEKSRLSEQEIADATGEILSYSPQDSVIVNWNAAVMVGDGAEDVRAVLEFANVQLLELRWLDRQLDKALEQSYETLSRRQSRGIQWSHSFDNDLKRVSELQIDSALLFEGLNNALKLLGDQYLSRVYRSAARRLYLTDWDRSIQRKITTIGEIYETLVGRINNVRMEMLELIIIVLFVISIALSIATGVH